MRGHLEEQGETYLEHFGAACKISYTLLGMAAKCFVHSLFPFLFTTAVSSRLEYLHSITIRTKK